MKKALSLILIAIIVFVGGFLYGQHHTIINAQLHSITADTYTIDFNGQLHIYTID
jgi:hypothetical protein